MKIIDGQNMVLGRLASYVAKEALKGEEIVVLNCEKIIITGNKKDIKENFEKRRRMFGNCQKGPKHPKTSEKIVKRTIRGMLPDYRMGKGRVAFKKITCHAGIPKEFQNIEKIIFKEEKKCKFARVKEFSK